MSGLKLIYFDGRGRAEVIRVLLAAAGQKYEDKRIDFKDWEKEKPKSKFNSLPNLIYRGKTYGQSLAILTFLAREFGLYGKNNEEGLRCDTVGQFLNEIRTELFTLMFVKDEPKKTELTTAAKESIPKKLKYLEELAVENGKTGFFVGSKLSYADIMLFDAWNMIKSVIPEAETGNDYPEMKKILRSVQAVPTIKTYLSTRKDSPF